MANQSNNNAKFWVSILLGLLAIGLGFYGAFFLQVKTNLQWIFIVLLLLTGIVSLSVLWGGTMKVSEKYVKATNAFALMVFLIVVIFNLFQPPAAETSLKIQVRQANGASALANEKQVLKISMGKDTKVHDLDGNAEVLLNASADTDSIEISIQNANYQLVKTHNSTAFFKIPKTEVLTLIVEPSLSRCCLEGRVMFEGKIQSSLTNITIQAAGVRTQTDAQGHFRLEIPKAKQLENLTIEAFNATHKGSILGNTASPCDIKLTRK
jgi:hypothetical protein